MSQTFNVTGYKGVREISLSPEGSLVVIAGANGAGKSSFIDAFVELFDPKGTRLTPKPIRDGADEARAEFIDTDLGVRIVRTWKNNDAGKLEVFALDGAKYSKPAEMIADLTGGLIFDPVAFLNLDEKKQRDALLAKVDLPFDLDALTREKAGAQQRRLEAGRDVTRLQGALSSMPNPLDAPESEVSAQDILDEIQSAQEFERDGETLRRSEADAAADLLAKEQRVDQLEQEIARARAALSQADDDYAAISHELKHWEQTPERPNLDRLRAKLAAVDETNKAVRARQEYARVAAEYAAAATAQQAAQDEIDDVEQRKLAGLEAAEFPVEGLSVAEDGVTFEGIPFSQVNSAARRRVAFAVATAGNPKLRLVIVKDGDLLDADSLAAIRAIADERGYTVLVERDRDESRRIGFTIADGALAEAGTA